MNPQDQPTGPRDERHDLQPDQPISPREQQAPSLPAPVQPETVAAAEPQQSFYRPTDNPAPTAPAPVAPVPGQPITAAPTQPNPAQANVRMHDNGREVVWRAHEFVNNDKTPAWFLGMVFVSLFLVALVYLITRDVFNTIIVGVAAVIFGVVGGRPPRQLQYAVDDHGIEIGRRFYPYEQFRSFSIAVEGNFRSIVFMPLKRFMPPLSVYYDPADEQRIGEVIAAHLPLHQHQHDLTEQLMRRIRF